MDIHQHTNTETWQRHAHHPAHKERKRERHAHMGTHTSQCVTFCAAAEHKLCPASTPPPFGMCAYVTRYVMCVLYDHQPCATHTLSESGHFCCCEQPHTALCFESLVPSYLLTIRYDGHTGPGRKACTGCACVPCPALPTPVAAESIMGWCSFPSLPLSTYFPYARVHLTHVISSQSDVQIRTHGSQVTTRPLGTG